MFKSPLNTWDKSKGLHTRLIWRMREQLDERIARESSTGVVSTMIFSDTNNLEAMGQEFGMGRRMQTPNSFNVRQAVRRI